jgi:hypothetical protein
MWSFICGNISGGSSIFSIYGYSIVAHIHPNRALKIGDCYCNGKTKIVINKIVSKLAEILRKGQRKYKIYFYDYCLTIFVIDKALFK